MSFEDRSDVCLMIEHQLVDSPIVVRCPKLHNLQCSFRADQRLHLLILAAADDDVEVRAFFVGSTVLASHGNMRIRSFQLRDRGSCLLRVRRFVPVIFFVDEG